MDEIIEKERIKLEDMIYEIRGVQVMLSSDVAKLYQVETRRINEAVYRNEKKNFLNGSHGQQVIMRLMICGRKMRPQI